MRKILVFEDDEAMELSPLTYEEFLLSELWSGNSEEAFKQFLYHNGFAELDDIKEEFLETATIILEDEEPEIDYEIEYGRMEWDEEKECYKVVETDKSLN